jgi:hypothetical protein
MTHIASHRFLSGIVDGRASSGTDIDAGSTADATLLIGRDGTIDFPDPRVERAHFDARRVIARGANNGDVACGRCQMQYPDSCKTWVAEAMVFHRTCDLANATAITHLWAYIKQLRFGLHDLPNLDELMRQSNSLCWTMNFIQKINMHKIWMSS